MITLLFPLLLTAQETTSGKAATLCMIIACIMFGICAFLYFNAPAPNQPGPWASRLMCVAFFFWTLSNVILMWGL